MPRIRAGLRRVDGAGDLVEGPRPISRGPLTIDSGRHEVWLHGKSLNLTVAEFRLLRALASHPGKVLTRDQLLHGITEGSVVITDRNVDVHVRSIR